MHSRSNSKVTFPQVLALEKHQVSIKCRMMTLLHHSFYLYKQAIDCLNLCRKSDFIVTQKFRVIAGNHYLLVSVYRIALRCRARYLTCIHWWHDDAFQVQRRYVQLKLMSRYFLQRSEPRMAYRFFLCHFLYVPQDARVYISEYMTVLVLRT